MVKCDSCVLANEMRYSRPSGQCEECHVVTPYSDRLCVPCSESHQRCQCCRSKRVQALMSIPATTVPLVEALEANAQQQRREQAQARAHAHSTHNTPRPQEESKQQAGGSYATLHGTQQTQSARYATPRSARPTSASPRDQYASLTATHSQHFLTTSPFHFQNATTYSLPADMDQLSLTAPASSFDPRLALVPAQQQNQLTVQLARDMDLPKSGLVILSPSGKLQPSTLTPLSPRMAIQQNARGAAPTIRDGNDAFALVESWPKAELVSTVFHYYCNWKSTKLQVQLSMNKFRHFAIDAGLVGPGDASQGTSTLSSNRLDILYTQSTRPLSGQKAMMTEGQFFEALGAIALWRYGGGAPNAVRQANKLVPCLDKLLERNLVRLAAKIVESKRGGIYLRAEEFDPVVSSVLLRYEEGLKKIFIRFSREYYADGPRADETLSHPLLEDGWKAFCREYDFFPTHLAMTSVLKIFLATASGLALNGQHEKPAMSFDDFLHGFYQLAQICFTLTPNAIPIERIELALSKVDSLRRELAFQPVGQRVRMQDAAASGGSQALLTDGSNGGGSMIPYKGESSSESSGQGPYDGLYSLFSAQHLSCARDLFNLACNTASQTSYSEILTRVAWVKLLREAQITEKQNFPAAAADIAFNKVLADHAHAHGGSSTSIAFAQGRTMTFPLFLTGLMEVACKRFPNVAVQAAIRTLFQDYLEPLLQAKISDLQKSAQAVALPLGAGVNGSGAVTQNVLGATQSGVIGATGNWGVKGFDERGYQQAQLGLDSTTGSSDRPGSPTLYPNHPSFLPPKDVLEILTTDPDIGWLLQHYSKPLETAFYRASWEGVEAVHGVSIPRISSSLLIHAAPSVTLQNQASWDQFLQQKNLLSEHAFRRWIAMMKIVPDLVAHKQVTMLFREGNIGFDRTQNQFVLNYLEFQSTLLRIALLAFSGTAYIRYSTPASKLELLFFLLDQNSNGGFSFRGFKFMPGPSDSKETESALMKAATNMGRQWWERKSSSELGVRALLLGESEEYTKSRARDQPPQEWSHGKKGFVPLASPSHATAPIRGFNTSMLVPRAQFATEYRSPSPENPTRPLQNEPTASPTKHLFSQTPFVATTRPGTSTRFAQNVPAYAQTPLKSPKGAHTKRYQQ